MLHGYRHFIVYIKTDGIYKNITENVKTRFDSSDYVLDRPLLNEKKKQAIGFMKDVLGGKIITKLVGLRANTYSYLIDGDREDKKAKGTKRCVIKTKLKLENYNNWLEANQLENKINCLGKNEINLLSLKRDHKEFMKTMN